MVAAVTVALRTETVARMLSAIAVAVGTQAIASVIASVARTDRAQTVAGVVASELITPAHASHSTCTSKRSSGPDLSTAPM